MLKGSLKVIRGRNKGKDNLLAAVDNLDAGHRKVNNGAIICEKDTSQDNLEEKAHEELKDKIVWTIFFIFDPNLNFNRFYFVMSRPLLL